MHIFTERFETVRKQIESPFVQECRDVLGDRAVHCWGVVATGPEHRFCNWLGLSFSTSVERSKTVTPFSRTVYKVWKPGVVSDAAICRQSDSDELASPAFCETVQANE